MKDRILAKRDKVLAEIRDIIVEKNCEKICSILLMIFIFLLNGFYTLNGSKGFGKQKFILALCIVVALIKVMLDFNVRFKNKVKNYEDISVVILAVIITLIFYWHNKDTRLAVSVLTMFACLYEDMDKIIKYFFYSKTFFFVIVLLTGGYIHINGVALHGGMIILLYICLKNNMKWTDIGVIFIAFLALAIYTDSGSAKIAMIATIILLLAVKVKRFMWLYKSKLISLIYPFAMFVNVYFGIVIESKGYLPYIYNLLPDKINELLYSLILFIDKVCSYRLTLAGVSIREFGMSFWGNNVDYSKIWEGLYFNLDSGFMWLIQQWGYFMTFIFLVMTIFLILYLIKIKKYNYVVASIIIALWSFNEDMLVSVGTNFLITFMLMSLLYFLRESKILIIIKKNLLDCFFSR